MDTEEIRLSIVTPVFQGRDCLEELYRRIVETMNRMGLVFEIVMVNDGSRDDSWEVISQLAGRDRRVKGINLSRNFGQHHAITAGIDHAVGDWIVVMDCDLQHRPEDIQQLYEKAQTGFDVVFAKRLSREDHFLKRATSRCFHMLYNALSGLKVEAPLLSFLIISSTVADVVRRMRERSRSFGLMLLWLGFDTGYVELPQCRRYAGKSSYTFLRSLNLAVDSITSQSNRPLQLSIKLGFFIAFLSFAYGAYLVVRYFAYGIPVPGWTTVVVSQFFIGGLLFANLGLLGLYLGRIFDETKGRPLYAVKERVNCPAAGDRLDCGTSRLNSLTGGFRNPP